MMITVSSLRTQFMFKPCLLTEPDGTRLGEGTLHTWFEDAGQTCAVVRLDRPGRLIERCLGGELRRLFLSIAGAAPCWVEIDRLTFDPQLGRVCVLRLSDGAIAERSAASS
jgi:hypothetical protein